MSIDELLLDRPALAVPTGPGSTGAPSRALSQVGRLFSLALDVLLWTFRRPFQTRELVEQFWFVASVSILPAALVAIPFGAVIALQLGSLTVQIGAQSFTGAASVLAVIQQASPIVTALMIAGAAGSAICADLGARTIREEIDAMAVLGVSPVQRLVVPRVWAAVLVALLLNGMVSVVGVARRLLLQRADAGRHARRVPGQLLGARPAVGPLGRRAQGGDLRLRRRGRRRLPRAHPAPGPKGVGDAVNQSVVITFLLLFCQPGDHDAVPAARSAAKGA